MAGAGGEPLAGGQIVIASVAGQVVARHTDRIVVEVGGVGLSLVCPPRAIADCAISERIRLATCMVVREDAIALYGFADEAERDLFEQLQTVSGVGPRLALTILSSLTADQVRQAVAVDDLTTLTSVPGIGRKGAQRLVLELKDRLGPPQPTTSSRAAQVVTGPAATSTWQGQVHAALVGLGWNARDADQAVAVVAAEYEIDLREGDTAAGSTADGADVSSLLRRALQALDRR